MQRAIYASSGKNTDLYYAVRVDIPDPFFYIDTGSTQYVFLDHREYGVFAEHNKNPSVKLVLVNPLMAEAAKLGDKTSGANRLAWVIFQKYGLTGTVEVPTSFPLDMADFLRSKGYEIKPVAPFSPVRLCKTPTEIKAVRAALKNTQHAFVHIEQVLAAATVRDGVIFYEDQPLTSEDLKLQVERVLLDHDMLNFEGIIISCGPHAAIPHHRGAGILRAGETIICDIFPKHRASGYFADMTRTYVKGEPSAQVKKMYAAVQEAQEAAEAKIRPGVTGSEIHQTCVDIFLSKEFHTGDRGFIHGTGHGLGLDVHEPPYLSLGSNDVLQEGHVVTVEPGLYYPDSGGVRIEDVVVVTKNGSENLTQYHKNYIIP